MDWARLLAYITGRADQELLLRNDYLLAENRILKTQIKGRLLLSDAERATLAEIGHRLGRKALEGVAAAAKPDTILGWYRKLIADKFDGSKARRSHGRPKIDEETENLVVRIAKENPSWAMTAFSVPWLISDTACQTKRWVIFCVAMTSLPLRSESTPRAGKTSSVLIWMF